MQNSTLLGTSFESYQQGIVVSQYVPINSPVYKVSLFFNLIDVDSREYIEDSEGVASWSALNFQATSNAELWKIYETNYTSSDTCDQGFLTNATNSTYSSADEVYLSAPQLTYDLYLSEGSYNVYVKSYGPGTFWYRWNTDIVPNNVNITSVSMIWKKIGSVDISEAGINHFYVYAGVENAETLMIDQFLLINIEDDDGTTDGSTLLYDLTSAPFNTYVRVKDNNNITRTHNWLSSNKIKSPEWYNYELNGHIFDEGLYIEYIIVSGRKDFNAQWNYTSSANNLAYLSTNFGRTFELAE